MLPWRLEEIKFGSKYNTWIIISAASHIIMFLLVIIISQFSFSNFQSKILEILQHETIDVELVSLSKQDPFEIPQAPQPKESFETNELPTSHAVSVPQEVSIGSSTPTKHNAQVELKRYEQLLSKHIATVLKNLPKDLQLPTKLFVWVKIDKHGDIYDFGFKPPLSDQKTIDFLETAISIASPVPTPPEAEFSSNLMSYIIPLNFS